MTAVRLDRAACVLAAVWAGQMAGFGFIVAPVLFAALARADAGRVAARLFEIDAYVGLAMGAALVVFALRRGLMLAVTGASRFSAEMLLALAALFCIVAGHFALQPLLESARQGQADPSFAALHGIASVFFAIKLGVVVVLAWRLTRPGAPATPAAPPSSG